MITCPSPLRDRDNSPFWSSILESDFIPAIVDCGVGVGVGVGVEEIILSTCSASASSLVK